MRPGDRRQVLHAPCRLRQWTNSFLSLKEVHHFRQSQCCVLQPRSRFRAQRHRASYPTRVELHARSDQSLSLSTIAPRRLPVASLIGLFHQDLMGSKLTEGEVGKGPFEILKWAPRTSSTNSPTPTLFSVPARLARAQQWREAANKIRDMLGQGPRSAWPI